MSTSVVLVTGAGGEIGHALIEQLAQQGHSIIAADIRELEPQIARHCTRVLSAQQGDVTSEEFLRAACEFRIERIFHLAAVLSTAAERNPAAAHRINVDGTVAILELAQQMGQQYRCRVQVLFPSTIAVYGFASLEDKHRLGKVSEDDALQPQTIYGIAKLHCERLGIYYSTHYKRLAAAERWVDFRAVRFPGLISATTLPTGGTSDYASEMLHAAARGEPYHCFVAPQTRIPFMAMPDGIRALLMLADAPEGQLSRRVYNVGAFAPTAAEIAAMVQRYFPGAQIDYRVDTQRQAIVDSWCADVDDSAARRDWGWQPQYDFERAFAEYLVPGVRARYERVSISELRA